jgi:hypothetical protein
MLTSAAALTAPWVNRPDRGSLKSAALLLAFTAVLKHRSASTAKVSFIVADAATCDSSREERRWCLSKLSVHRLRKLPVPKRNI